MLAHLPPDDVDRIYSDSILPSKTDRTIQERKVLLHALNEVREQGFAYDEGESEEGVWAVAGCVRDSVGMPRAAVSIVVPEVRLREKKIPRWTEIITDAAMEISGKIGFKPN
jgi:DNA-binding IclR family transcriptional regulator